MRERDEDYCFLVGVHVTSEKNYGLGGIWYFHLQYSRISARRKV
jgi:hypothetical protein